MSNWNQDNITGLRAFMSSNPQFIQRLNERKPKSEGSTIEHRAISGAERAGFELCMSEIALMSQDKPQDPTNPHYQNIE